MGHLCVCRAGETVPWKGQAWRGPHPQGPVLVRTWDSNWVKVRGPQCTSRCPGHGVMGGKKSSQGWHLVSGAKGQGWNSPFVRSWLLYFPSGS